VSCVFTVMGMSDVESFVSGFRAFYESPNLTTGSSDIPMESRTEIATFQTCGKRMLDEIACFQLCLSTPQHMSGVPIEPPASPFATVRHEGRTHVSRLCMLAASPTSGTMQVYEGAQ
jgi:hypothetical protein